MGDSEQDLSGRVAELEAAVGAWREFLAVVAHELRNPMTPILMRLGALSDDARADPATPEAVVSGIEALKGSIANYVRRAEVLLHVSRLSSGRFLLHPAEVDLSALLRAVASEAEPMARFVRSALSCRVQDGVAGIWDRTAVEQIVDNLLSNALKYGGGKPVELTLSADAATAFISVRDQGIGIAAEDQARIFEHFERAGGPEHRAGFGVGLWVVRQLVEAMGGRISIESAPGRGTTCRVDLPLRLKGKAVG